MIVSIRPRLTINPRLYTLDPRHSPSIFSEIPCDSPLSLLPLLPSHLHIPPFASPSLSVTPLSLLLSFPPIYPIFPFTPPSSLIRLYPSLLRLPPPPLHLPPSCSTCSPFLAASLSPSFVMGSISWPGFSAGAMSMNVTAQWSMAN